MRVGMLLPPTGTVQVINKSLDPLSARLGDLSDHPQNIRSVFRTSRGSLVAPECLPHAPDLLPDHWTPSGMSADRLPHFFRRSIEAFRPPKLSAAYGRRSPARCPVAFSFATAWLRFTPIRRTSPDARISSASASTQRRTADEAAPPRAAARAASAAYAPRPARPARPPPPAARTPHRSARTPPGAAVHSLPRSASTLHVVPSVPPLIAPAIAHSLAEITFGDRSLAGSYPVRELIRDLAITASVCMDRARSIHIPGLWISCFGR